MKKKLLLALVFIGVLFMVGCSDEKTESTENAQQESETKAKKKPPKIAVKSDEAMVEGNGREVYIKGYLPNDDEKHPAIIMCHGYNGCHSDFTNECIYFAQNGIIAYLLRSLVLRPYRQP